VSGSSDQDRARLRVVEERTGHEEVVRLSDSRAEPRVRLEPVEPAEPLESARRLEVPVGGDFRSIEPDIDAIRGAPAEGPCPESPWVAARRAAPTPYGWFVLILLGLGVAAAWSLVAMWRGEEDPGESAARVDRAAALTADELAESEAARTVEALEEIAAEFLAAGGIEEMLPLLRDPSRVEPLMREWYEEEGHRFDPVRLQRLTSLQRIPSLDGSFWLLRCAVEGGERGRVLFVEEREDGSLRVDWESAVCHQPMEWGRFADKRPPGESMVFRVLLGEDPHGYYSHEFADEERWQVYQLRAPGSEAMLFGYVERSSLLADELQRVVRERASGGIALQLRLRVPEDATSPRGVRIEELVGRNWLGSDGEGDAP